MLSHSGKGHESSGTAKVKEVLELFMQSFSSYLMLHLSSARLDLSSNPFLMQLQLEVES